MGRKLMEAPFMLRLEEKQKLGGHLFSTQISHKDSDQTMALLLGMILKNILFGIAITNFQIPIY